MTYYVLCVCVCLAVLFCAATAVSTASALLAPVALRRCAGWPAHLRATLWFALRSAPALLSLAVTFGLFLPAFLKLEPAFTRERISVRLGVLAGAGAVAAAATVLRLALAIVRGARIARRWRDAARPIDLGGGIRAFELAHAGNLVATTGVLFPSIFVSSEIVRALSRAELRAAVQHELAHVTSRDNLKRLIVRATPAPVARDRFDALERAWARDCELAADEASVHTGSSVVDLASALVKAARLEPLRAAPVATASFLVPAGQESAVAARLRRLTQLVEGNAAIAPRRPLRGMLLVIFSAVVTAAAFSSPALLGAAHDIIERLV